MTAAEQLDLSLEDELKPRFELKSDCCQWIEGDGDARVQCCGPRIHYKGESRRDRLSDWCEEHYRRVYVASSIAPRKIAGDGPAPNNKYQHRRFRGAVRGEQKNF